MVSNRRCSFNTSFHFEYKRNIFYKISFYKFDCWTEISFKKISWKRGLIFTLRNLEPKLTSEIYKKQVCSIPCFHANCLGEKSADRSLKAIQYGSSKGPPNRFWGSKDLPTSFSPVTSTNIRNSPQAFLTLSFISFTFRTPQKNVFFPGQILIKLLR